MANGKWCPLIKGKCVEHKCAFYMQIMGQNPNTGESVNEWGCAIQFLPMLIIENSQQQRQTGAATESFRNEMTKAHQSNQQTLMAAAKIIMSPQIQPGEDT